MIEADRQRYMVGIRETNGSPGTFRVTVVLKGLQQARRADGEPRRMPEHVVTVRRAGNDLAFDWSGSPDDPGPSRPELESEVRTRLDDRQAWIDRVVKLVAQVDAWARELGWETRRIDKRLDDSWVGSHVVPALLMQKETFRVLLEPIGRSAPGADGVVDLYLMPAYDDIASLYHYDGRWHLHYMRPDGRVAANVREAESRPLTRAGLRDVLAEMLSHAR